MSKVPDGQISFTDPDARSMTTSGRGTGMVGYNVQTAVDAKHHLIVAHEVTNVGHDRDQLSSMAQKAREAIGRDELTVLADRGYFKGEEILDCERAGIKTLIPKPPATRHGGYSTKPIFATSRPRMSIDARPVNEPSGVSRPSKMG